MGSAITNFNLIKRGEIPALERRGALAQEVVGEIVVIAFHQGSTDIETISGTPANAPEKMRKCKAGVSDTVVLGSISGGGRATLLDVMMVARKSQRGKSWSERKEVLTELHGTLSAEAKKMFPIAATWNRGLMSAFDSVPSEGGLLLRVRGKNKGYLCTGGK